MRMAIVDVDQGYTKTGNSGLSRFANKVSLVPFIGGFLSFPLGMLDTALEAGSWLIRGKVNSALTVAVAGTVGHGVNALSSASPLGSGSLTWWLGNAGASGLTGRSLGTHARALTEGALGAVSGAVGLKPQVLKSYPAGIGGIGGATQAGPGRWMTQAAQSRGEDPNAAYSRLMSNQSDHVAALEAAQSQSNHRGM